MTSAGIEPVTFQFVVQHLNYCANAFKDGITVNFNLQKIYSVLLLFCHLFTLHVYFDT